MKYSLINDICCPMCHHHLQLETSVADDAVVTEGILRCAICGAEYAIQKRIPNLIPSQHIERHKLDEMDGWVKLWQYKGMYDRLTLDDSFRLPYLDGVWRDVSRMFDLAMQKMNLTGNEMVLDIGAGQGWASRYFAEKGCKAIAVDIVADEYYGLGRSWAIMDHAGVYFEPVLGDGENLPFPDLKFDSVFFCGALHHFNDIDRVLKQVYRVLKPGGRLVASGEPSAAIFVKEATIQGDLEETRFGIVERRPKSYEYLQALTQAGFKDIQIDTYETYRASTQQIYSWIENARDNLLKAARLRYQIIIRLMFAIMLRLPKNMATRLGLYINGGNLLLSAIKNQNPPD